MTAARKRELSQNDLLYMIPEKCGTIGQGGVLAEAALANAQLVVARAVMQAEFRREGATAEVAAARAEEAVEKMATQLVFGRVPAAMKARQRRAKPEVKVIYFRSFFEANEDDAKAILPTEQLVRLAVFAQ